MILYPSYVDGDEKKWIFVLVFTLKTRFVVYTVALQLMWRLLRCLSSLLSAAAPSTLLCCCSPPQLSTDRDSGTQNTQLSDMVLLYELA